MLLAAVATCTLASCTQAQRHVAATSTSSPRTSPSSSHATSSTTSSTTSPSSSSSIAPTSSAPPATSTTTTTPAARTVTLPVMKCPTTYAVAQTPTATVPGTIVVSLPADLTYPIGAYTDQDAQAIPILGPSGFDCSMTVGADGSAAMSFHEPNGHQPWASLGAQSSGGCVGCGLDAACAIFPAAAALLAKDQMGPCTTTLSAGETLTPVSGRSDATLFTYPEGVGDVQVYGAMIFRPTTRGEPGPQEASMTCSLGNEEACSEMIGYFLTENWRLAPA